MANRKIKCKNTECKHYKSGDICDTSITIGRFGKCESFEKGFIYYFQIVWRSLHRKNYVDEIEISNNPDLKIGLFYVMECFDLCFSTMKWGPCRIYMLRDRTEGNALKAEEIVTGEMDSDKFREYDEDFENGILPEESLEKNEGKASKQELKMPLTEKQKDFLLKYFKDMRDTLTAEEFVN